MKMTKRILSLVLCFVMLVGLMPAITLNAEAAGEPIDAAVIFSDLHTSSGDYKESTVKGIMTALKNTGKPFSSVVSAGDAFSVNYSYQKYTGYTSTITGYIRDVLGELPVYYVWSDHDRYAVQQDDSTTLSNESGFVYGAGADGQYGTDDDANYYIYSLSMADLSTNNRYNADFHTDAEVTQAIADFTAAAEKLDQTKPLFIASHQPLLDRRNDNGHAYEWATAINEVAKSMDVAFFFGHNHRYDVEKDYYYGKGETMSVCSDSSGNAKDVTLNFTHMCAGYMAPSSTGSTSDTTRQGVAVAITIYADSINYTTYDANGVYTGSYALNETVKREFAKTEPEVPATSEPTEPETSEPSVPETSEPSVPETSEPEASEPETEVPGIDEPLSNSVTTGGTTYEEKTVYVKVDSFKDGEKYLLVGEDAPSNGSPLAMVNSNGSDTSVPVTVISGSVTVNGVTYSDGYIELNNANAVFTASGSSSNGYTLKNGSYYIGGTSATTLYNSSSSAVRVEYDADAVRLRTASGTTRYLYYSTYNSETWKWSTSINSTTSSRAMYIYQEMTVQIPTSNKTTYTMQADNLDVILAETGTTTGQLNYSLLANGKAADLPSGGSYKFEIVNDTNDIIDSVANDGTVTFTGEEGSCYVKVSYTWGENTVYKYATVTARKPFYALEITNEADGAVITTTQSVKGNVTGTTRDYSAKLLLNGKTESDIDLSKVTWSSNNTAIATVDSNGVVTFQGAEGTVQITATYEHGDAVLTDTINIYVTHDTYTHPSDGTNDFPEYPNEGAIRFDKTAEAVGTFSETGVAKLELSMTGVPFTTNNRMDVVLMLDRSSSMQKVSSRIPSTVAATKVFIKNIVMNEDGTFNNNRIMVMDFLGGNLAEGSQHKYESNLYTLEEEKGYQVISSQEELDALFARIDNGFVAQGSLYGTEYAQGLKGCYDALVASREDGNKQFCVFMSDGIPNYYQGEKTHYTSTSSIIGMYKVTNANSSSATVTRDTDYEYEYYSTQMKNEGVTVFTVGLGLANTNSAWSSGSAAACEKVASIMLNDIAGPAGETADDRDTGNAVSKKDEYFFSVADADAATKMEDVFGNIAQKILEAATNVVVTDKINDEYTMVFDIPQGAYSDHNGDVNAALASQEFYIEFLEYALDANHERTTSTSKLKLYLGKTGNTYYAATANGSTNGANKFADPVFTPKADDARGYWSEVDSTYTAKAGEIVIKVGSTTYKFIENGSGTHNMTSGAYAYGTIDATTKMSTDLVILTPYFAYSAETRMLAWTVDKLTTVEYALVYFLYLDNSATDIGEDTETPEGPYPTNDWASITYTNFNGTECRQDFPEPQLTWNGAQVSYVFYLVNGAGQPINKSGQVVDFANATFITDIHTKHVVWNDDETKEKEGHAYLDANYEAEALLTSDYTLYDPDASYVLLVYEDHEGSDLKNYFTIDGGEANGSVSSTTKVYNTKAGTKYSAYRTYTKDDVADSFDFSNTTVAFAVVWKPALVADTVVVDYGLDVLIDVVRNDLLQNTVSGISAVKTPYGNIAMNTGVSTGAKFGSAGLTIDGNTITIEDENRIRFHQGDMVFTAPVTFYYESPVKFYENSNEQTGYLYSSVTVIPATTIYYEDSFLTLTSLSKGEDGTFTEDATSKWTQEGTTVNATQDQDRPGESKISADLDADNNYGYDSAYEEMSTHSLGSAAKINVNASTRGEATFTFYGTGFDVISTTSNATGTLIVQLYSGASATGTAVKSLVVDTYYSYVKDGDNWVISTGEDGKNALYQVPVMKMTGLEYGQYTVKIVAGYNSYFDDVDDSSDYDLYLDAIRIYDPTGNLNADANNAYVKDDEGFPIYKELRNLVITADSFGKEFTVDSTDFSNNVTVDGIVFIDGDAETGNEEIANYTSYGPNNELYLAPGQAVSFTIADAFVKTGTENAIIPVGIQLAIKTTGNSADVEIFNPGTSTTTEGNVTTTTFVKNNLLKQNVQTATDMYYDITALAKDGKTIVIYNPGTSGIISITNIKFTFAEAASVKAVTTTNDDGTEDVSEASVANISEQGAVYSLRSLRAYSVSEVTETEPTEPEATEPETTVPETTEPEVTEPETTEPETTEPEVTEPETTVPEETEPEETEPSDQEKVEEIVKEVGKIIKKLLGWLFG